MKEAKKFAHDPFIAAPNIYSSGKVLTYTFAAVVPEIGTRPLVIRVVGKVRLEVPL